MTRLGARLFPCALLLLASGCGTPTYRVMVEEKGILISDESRLSPDLARDPLAALRGDPAAAPRLAIVARKDLSQAEQAALENAFLPTGIEVRVGAVERANNPSNERLKSHLVLGDTAVLYLSAMDWGANQERYYRWTPPHGMTEVSGAVYATSDPGSPRVTVAAPPLLVDARLVQEGRTIANFHLRARLVDHPWPEPYAVSFQWEEGQPKLGETSDRDRSLGYAAQERLLGLVLSRLAWHLTPPDLRPATQETAPPPADALAPLDPDAPTPQQGPVLPGTNH